MPVNRLAAERSPYLLQHAHNPVDWWPWGPEALAEARRRDVPIFLSIGYSTCYWCHVMERECFENATIGRQMSDQFVCIKVDREERPDLDDVYMAAVQMLTGHGGWPMSVFLEPQTLKPFWAGTYFPPVPARGLPSFPQVLTRLSTAWAARRGEVLKQAESVAEALRDRLAATQTQCVLVGPRHVGMAVQTLLTIFDRTDGGFGRAPKFPQPVYLDLLLTVRQHLGEEGVRAAADHALKLTLDRMATGGMFDQLAGGFHRYSVDTHWLVPHFEKMLYDQAQLLPVYAQASMVYNDPWYAQIAQRLAAYVRAEMTSPHGAFYSAQDAEVDGREGLNYVWTPRQITDALGEGSDDAKLALEIYGLNAGTNFTDPHHPEEPATNVLRLAAPPCDEATRLRIALPDLQARLDRINQRLLAVRATRTQPRLDDKIITAWNGMMIEGLARAAGLLRDSAMLDSATVAARWLIANHLRDGHLLRATRDGQGTIRATLEDYAALAGGLIALHEAASTLGRTEDSTWALQQARSIVSDALQRFASPQRGAALLDALPQPGEPALFIQARSTYDGAMPSAASMMLNVLLSLDSAERAGVSAGATAPAASQWLEAFIRLLGSISPAIVESPIATANAVRAVMRAMADPTHGGEAFFARQRALGATEELVEIPQDVGIEVLASADEVTLAPDQPAELMLRIVIPPGFHINDGFAGEASGGRLMPLRVMITGGEGVRVFADYPRGTPPPPSAPPHDQTHDQTFAHRIHEGTIELPIALELHGQWSGTPQIAVAFQPCTDRACLPARRAVLDVAITPAQ